MPTAQPAPLSGPGTFSTVVIPALNTPLAIKASGSISIGPSSQGYIVANVIDAEGNSVAGIAAIITSADLAAGSKNFSINASGPGFISSDSLQVNVSTRQLDGADPSDRNT